MKILTSPSTTLIHNVLQHRQRKAEKMLTDANSEPINVLCCDRQTVWPVRCLDGPCSVCHYTTQQQRNTLLRVVVVVVVDGPARYKLRQQHTGCRKSFLCNQRIVRPNNRQKETSTNVRRD